MMPDTMTSSKSEHENERELVISQRELIELVQVVRRVAKDMERHEHALFGDDGGNGLVARVNEIERVLASWNKFLWMIGGPILLALIFFIGAVLTHEVQLVFH